MRQQGVSEASVEVNSKPPAEMIMRRGIAEGERMGELTRIIYSLSSPTFVISPDHKVIYWNKALESLTGKKEEELRGTDRHWTAFYEEERPCLVDLVVDGRIDELDQRYDKWSKSKYVPDGYQAEKWLRIRGGERYILFTAAPVYDGEGNLIAGVETFEDITERKKLEKRLEDTVKKLKASQEELSTPVVQIWDKTLALPLIGVVDSLRAQKIMETLLNRIVETQSEMVILDITGVSSIDTQVVNHLIKTIQAAKLLGAECVITGIKPKVAQTMIQLGLDMESFPTRRSLRDGLMYALEKLGYRVGGRGT